MISPSIVRRGITTVGLFTGKTPSLRHGGEVRGSLSIPYKGMAVNPSTTFRASKMKFIHSSVVFAVIALTLSACSSMPSNVQDSSIQPTYLDLIMPAADLHKAILRAVAEWGWKLESESKDGGIIVAMDPTQMAGMMFSYRVRYTFTYDGKESGTVLRIKGTAYLNGDNGPIIKEGPTSSLKLHEEKAASRLRQYLGLETRAPVQSEKSSPLLSQ